MPLTQAFARLVRPASPVRTVVAALACTGPAVAIRYGLDPVIHGSINFLTYGPAVLLASLWAGGRSGVLTAALCLSAAWALVPPHFALTGNLPRDLVLTAVFVATSSLTIGLASGFRRTLQAQAAALDVERDATASLAANERRLRLAQEAARLGIWEWDVQADRFYLSSGYRRNWSGVAMEEAPTLEDLLGRVHPDDRAQVREAIRQAVSDGVPYQVEYRAPRGDGGWRWLASRGELVRDEAGRPVQMYGVNRDVTAEKEAAEALRESENKFRGVFESPVLGLGLASLGLEDEYYEVNDRFLEIVGATREQYERREWRWEQATPEEHLPKDYRAVEQVRARGWSDPYEKEYLRPDGSRAPVLVAAAALPGRPDKLVATVQDISDLKAAERALRESEARFRAMADSAPAPIWITDPQGGIAFLNEAFASFAGRARETLAGRAWVEMVHPEDLDRVLAARTAAVAAEVGYGFEARFRRADGEWRWMQAHCQPRSDGDGRFLGYVGIAFDVTKAKRAEADLKRMNEFLEERVNAALAEKAHAEAALLHAQKLEAVGRLTGGVAHDFNNLLTVVIGSLDLILKSGDESKRRRLAEAAMGAARRGAALTHQLLAFSRRQALRPELCDVSALVRDGEPLLRRAVGESVRFEARVDGPVRARVDPAQFEAALLNLVVNARDATGEGGMIEVSVGQVRLDEGEAPEIDAGDYVRVAVRDTGDGMAPDVLARVFEPFFTTKAPGKGTGLGLAQVYGFARQSGGGVTVESTPGAGTTVAMHLPLAEARAELAPARRARAELVGPAARLNVLLVEDDPGVAAVAEDMLAALGHHVRRAEDAAQALAVLRSDAELDLLLTDLIMPGGINGVELARQAEALRPGLQVLLSSGYAGEAVDQALGDAPWPLLRKPYAEDELAEALQAFAPARRRSA